MSFSGCLAAPPVPSSSWRRDGFVRRTTSGMTRVRSGLSGSDRFSNTSRTCQPSSVLPVPAAPCNGSVTTQGLRGWASHLQKHDPFEGNVAVDVLTAEEGASHACERRGCLALCPCCVSAVRLQMLLRADRSRTSSEADPSNMSHSVPTSADALAADPGVVYSDGT
jgi:hypothetical protein